ncbi:thioredoxin-dependent thiol peroxidase [Shouchella clausii]|uniref:thioredoxin-dependent thiol peroxidase n=1 Tax=Shouchella TaxID=2893057 RepID=UPI0004E64812|nr:MULTISPECIES: thioredoxin-dependent thiol peroxidase [Shouchella]ALA51491.1 Thiol peroxidase, Bcp-type [Shouchella clausii]MBU3233017.1 thioredoxin-dependent thiol peroxidase [Shouchella clausii]MBU3264704.1 thioredoxin-dependent thiol peroxidase [Shouchella clausii]MBU3508958.1 thioredoxin-dependent thiol peroxidase [Shouchella clausii]MBU3534196.1 thioredoxin-dependent thiol peroxidase [Shouchella clausii]
MVRQGEKAPDFELPANGGKTIRLSDYKGSYIVLYFYPKDMTPGCTTEACDFRDQTEAFKKEGAIVLGVSPDPADKHDKFAEKHGLPYPLVADEDLEAAKAYGVWQLKKNFGKEYMGIVRSTFVIGKDFTVLKEWRNVKVKNHVEDVLAFVKGQNDE